MCNRVRTFTGQARVSQCLIGIDRLGQSVRTFTAIQHIVTGSTGQNISTGSTGNRVGTGTASQNIVTRSAIDRHRPGKGTGINRIGTVTTGQTRPFNVRKRIARKLRIGNLITLRKLRIGQCLVGISRERNLITIRTTIQHIDSVSTGQYIITSVTRKRIGTGSTCQRIGTVTTGKRIGTRTSGQGIVTGSTGKGDRPRKGAAIDRVVAGSTGQLRTFNV